MKILTRWMLVLAGLALANPVCTQQVTRFRRIGSVDWLMERSDTVIDFDLDLLLTATKRACDIGQRVVDLGSFPIPQLNHLISRRCRAATTRTTTIHEVFGIVDKGGDKAKEVGEAQAEPFIMAALLSALVAGVGGAIWGRNSSPNNIERISEELNRVINVVKVDDRRMAQLHEANIKLEDLIRSSHLNDTRRGSMLAAAAAVESSFSILEVELVHVEQTLLAALEGRLSPTALRPKALQRVLNGARASASRLGGRLATTSLWAALRHPASVGVFRSRYMRLVLHVPIRSKSTATLYRFIPAPMQIGTGYVEWQDPRGSTLLLIDKGKRYFVEMTEEELDKCHTLTGLSWTCPPKPLSKDMTSARTCLKALYDGDKGAILKACDGLSHDHVDGVWAVDNGVVLLFSANLTSWEVHCGKTLKSTNSWQGLHQVKLGPGCSLASDMTHYRARRHTVRGSIILVSPAIACGVLELNACQIGGVNETTLLHMRRQSRMRLHWAEQPAQQLHQVALVDSLWDWPVEWKLAVLGVLVGLGLALALMTVCPLRWCRCQKQQQKHLSPHSDSDASRSSQEESQNSRRRRPRRPLSSCHSDSGFSRQQEQQERDGRAVRRLQQNWVLRQRQAEELREQERAHLRRVQEERDQEVLRVQQETHLELQRQQEEHRRQLHLQVQGDNRWTRSLSRAHLGGLRAVAYQDDLVFRRTSQGHPSRSPSQETLPPYEMEQSTRSRHRTRQHSRTQTPLDAAPPQGHLLHGQEVVPGTALAQGARPAGGSSATGRRQMTSPTRLHSEVEHHEHREAGRRPPHDLTRQRTTPGTEDGLLPRDEAAGDAMASSVTVRMAS